MYDKISKEEVEGIIPRYFEVHPQFSLEDHSLFVDAVARLGYDQDDLKELYKFQGLVNDERLDKIRENPLEQVVEVTNFVKSVNFLRDIFLSSCDPLASFPRYSIQD